MVIIGIAGGVASGKSVVATYLEQLGCTVLDADRIGHAVLANKEVIAAARRRWGAGVLNADGKINRGAVAERIFGGTMAANRELEYWEGETHPKITQRVLTHLAELAKTASCSAVVLDAPVMFKAGWDAFCDHILFVDVPREVRWERASSRGWTERQFADREASQLPLAEKRRRSTTVIDNSDGLEHTYEQVRSFWNSLSR